MKIILVFSPFVDPSYVPLGIAQLKSYIEQQLPEVRIYNLDLNNLFFNNLTKKEFLNHCKNLCLVCPKKEKHQKYIEKLYDYGKIYTICVNCLRDRNTKQFYYDVAKYNYLIKKVTEFFVGRRNCITTLTKDIIENESTIPQVLKNLLQDDLNKILKQQPDVVGFSIFCLEQLAYSLTIAKMLKDQANLPIIFGGAFLSHHDIIAFLRTFDFVDFVIGKEGEIGLTKFISYFKNKDFKNVPGLFYRRNKEVFHNDQEFIQDLDNLPIPDFSDFDLKQYLFPVPVLPITFSRGCFWRKCTFCTYYQHNPDSYKTKSIEKSINEIKYFNTQGIKYFFIDDDVISAGYLNLVSSAIIKAGLKIFFGAIVRPDKDFSVEILENIYRAGGRVFFWGVESTSQRMLDLMNKGTKIKDIKTVLKNADKVGFYNHLFMIRGFPTQTEEEIYNDMEFLQKKQRYIDSFFLHHFSLENGSYVYNNPKQFEIKNIKENTIYTRKKKHFYSSIFSFECKTKPNWRKITERENEIFKSTRKLFANNFQAYCHAHVLICASVNEEVGFGHRKTKRKNEISILQ